MITPELAERIRDFADGADSSITQETIRVLVDAASAEPARATEMLEDAFGRDLDFGTGGLRGIMGAGSNRMNLVTVARATQGLAAYVNSQKTNPSVAIACDSRINSREFGRQAARVLAGNGIRAYLFTDVRPTPQLSFAVRHLKADAGIVVTASHNPKEYSGYKVSWDDGGQVLPPHDRGIISEVAKVESLRYVKLAGYDEAVAAGLIVELGPDVDDEYLKAMDAVRHRRELAAEQGGAIKIVYTPLHGTGIRVVPPALERWGFTNVSIVEEQREPDGNFPTTKSPNPEERAALELALDLAEKQQADIVMATDPDADRIGFAVMHQGKLQLLNGNQAGALMAWYLCETLKEQGRLPDNGVIIKTIVTTELIAAIAVDYGVDLENCLTGFKYIAQLMRGYEEEAGTPGRPAREFIMGCEESYGYLTGTHARDKDAVVTACVFAEMALWAKTRGKTLIDLLNSLYAKHGVHSESQVSKTMPGLSGMKEIGALMDKLRTTPPTELAGIKVSMVTDIQNDTLRNLATGDSGAGPGLPESNVLLFHLADGSLVVARPSGTEPKIKFYFMVVDRDNLPIAPVDLPQRLDQCQQKDAALKAAWEKVIAG